MLNRVANEEKRIDILHNQTAGLLMKTTTIGRVSKASKTQFNSFFRAFKCKSFFFCVNVPTIIQTFGEWKIAKLLDPICYLVNQTTLILSEYLAKGKKN